MARARRNRLRSMASRAWWSPAESQRGNGAVVPSEAAADEVTGEFGAGSALKSMLGVGHASMEETSAAGTHQTSSGDRIEAEFAQPGASKGASKSPAAGSSGEAGQIQSAVLDGHVLASSRPAPKPGAEAPAELRAWAGKAVYEGAGEWLHLTIAPRIEDGGLQMTADKIDVSHETGDAFAHGNVKATWLNDGKSKPNGQGTPGQQGKQFSTAGHGGPGRQRARASHLRRRRSFPPRRQAEATCKRLVTRGSGRKRIQSPAPSSCLTASARRWWRIAPTLPSLQ